MTRGLRLIMVLQPMPSQAALFRGAGLAIVWPQLVARLAIGVALFGLPLRRFRKM